MTICPGRKGSSLEGGLWDRDFASDLEVIRAWQPSYVLSLLEDHEYRHLGVPKFVSDARASEIRWEFLPIVDGGIPDAAFENRWFRIGPTVRNMLRDNGRVLIHCRAGLGRTGLLAATLLVEFDEHPECAIARVRAARHGTIENEVQANYVRSRTTAYVAPSRDDAIAGCLYGGAIGDALGSAFEFLSPQAIESELGEPFVWRYRAALPGSLLYPRLGGQPTDDTAMALSVANVIASDYDVSATGFASAFRYDLDKRDGRFAEMFWQGGPGVATMAALKRLGDKAEPASCGALDAGGNGAAMRAHPVGFLFDRARVLSVAATQAAITHGHPAAIAAAQAVAICVHDALSGREPEVDVPVGIGDATFRNAWIRAHAVLPDGPERLPKQLTSIDMSGWETVAGACAIAFVYRDDPCRAVAAAAASGGDTDTVASIVGAIVGARHGFEALETTWVSELSARHHIDAALKRFHITIDAADLAQVVSDNNNTEQRFEGRLVYPVEHALLEWPSPPKPKLSSPLHRLLEAIHILHRRGYQRLRIVPGVSGTGMAWRCGITPSSNIIGLHGALARSFNWDDMPQYSSASEYDFFGQEWGFGPNSSPERIADRILQTFPEILKRSIGWDYAYAGWFTMIVGAASRGVYPKAFGDYVDLIENCWLSATHGVALPPPPRPQL